MGVRAVFLVGFMGSGKTTVGQELAHRLGWEFVDLDSTIESREKRCIAEIFDQPDGERAFRIAETTVLTQLVKSLAANCVVALGGGTFAFPKNRALLTDWPTVFLEAPLDELWRRCSQDAAKRPLARSQKEFAEKYWHRVNFYREATLTVETSGRQLPSICSEIENALRLHDVPDSLRTGEHS